MRAIKIVNRIFNLDNLIEAHWASKDGESRNVVATFATVNGDGKAHQEIFHGAEADAFWKYLDTSAQPISVKA